MSKYAIAKYGVDKYGDKAGSQIYYTSNIVAESSNYGSISVYWTPITPDPADTAPTHWKVVKSYLGAVDNPDDGITVDGAAYPTFRLTKIDTLDDSDANKEIIYSIWVYNSVKGWIFCGSVNTFSVGDDGTLNKISRWVPRAWLNEGSVGAGIGDITGEPEASNRLTQILSAYAFEYDFLRSQTYVLSKTSDPKLVHTSLLPSLVNDYGFNYEPSLGDTYHATLYSLGDAVIRNKGTKVGVSTYINALTHLTSNVTVGHNLLLDYNDASFEESLGRWSSSSGTFAQKSYVASDYPTPYSYDNQFPLRRVGYASLTTAATTAVTLSLPGNTYDISTYGIPIKPNTRYVFSGWAKRVGTVSATASAKIYWYNSVGKLISSTTAGSNLTITTSWAEFVSSSDSGRNGKLSPDNAYFAKVELTVTPSSATSVEYLFDMLQFCTSNNSFVYEDARLVTAYLLGDRTNLLLNPSFEAGSSFWTAYNGTLSTTSIGVSSSVKHGSYVGQLTSSSSTITGVVSDWVTAEPGSAVNFSGYVSGTSGRTVKARMEFSHRPTNNTTISATITNVTGNGTTVTVTANNTFTAGETVTISDVDPVAYNISGTIATATNASFTIASSATGAYVSGGTAKMNLKPSNTIEVSGGVEYYTNVVYYVESNPVTMDGTMKFLNVTGTMPLYEKDCGEPLVKVSLIVTNPTSNDVYTIDGLILQYGDSALEYFSGDGGILPSNPITTKYFAPVDCLWEKSERRSYVSNPSFETTTGWTTSGITLTSEVPAGFSSLYGTNSGKCVYSSTGYLETTVYLDIAAIGGEDYTASVYVRGAFTDYTISTNPGGTLPTSNTFSVSNANKGQWIRLHVNRKLAVGETSFNLRIAVTNPGGSSDTTFYIDGAQVEEGLIATKFINPANAPAVTTIPNPANTAVNMYTTQEASANGGRSSYINNYATKFSRLYNTLSLVMPSGSTWRVVPGYIRNQYPELVESLVSSASFEKNLGTWQAANSTLSRVISRGTLFGEYVTHGMAYASVKTTRTSGSPSFYFGAATSNTFINPGSGYYISAAIRAAHSSAYVPVRLKATFYNSGGTIHNYDNGGVSTQSIFQITDPLSSLTQWVHLSLVVPGFVTSANQFDAAGASYAIVEVQLEPTSFNAAQEFHLDRVIFRE